MSRSVKLMLAALVVTASVAGWPGDSRGRDQAAWAVKAYETMVRRAGLDPAELENYSVGQSHIDAAWRWRKHQTREKCIKTFSNAIEHMEQFPDFHFSQSAPQYYEWVMEDDPALFAQIKKYEAAGRWELVGGQWVEPDNVMPDGESFVRQRLTGMRFFQEQFGHTPEISWLLDSFGYQWNLPQILAKSGAKYFWTNKLTWNDTSVFPFHLFHWQAPDGSQVLAYFIQQTGYPQPLPNSELNKYYNTRFLLPAGASLTGTYASDYDQLQSSLTGEWLKVFGIFYGKGDGGHGPTTDEIVLQQAMQDAGYSRFARADELFAALAPYADRAPVWNDELYLEYHRGCLTTQGWIKRANRQAEQQMRTAEVTQAVASRLGFAYQYEKLRSVWKLFLLNQFHDILPGSSIPEVYEDAKKDYERILGESRDAAAVALAHLAERVTADAGEEPLLVMNPLGWERGGVVEVAEGGADVTAVSDGEGGRVPAQTGPCTLTPEDQCLFFRAEAVPAVGWRVYYLERSTAGVSEEVTTQAEGGVIAVANGLVSVAVDMKTGWLSSVRDQNGREYLAGAGNELMAWRDRAANYPAWNIQHDYLKQAKSMPNAASVEVTARGPVFVEITARRKFNKSEIVQTVRVYVGDPRVHLATSFDFHESDTLVKAGFDTSIAADKIVAETSYAVVERPTHPSTPAQKAQWEASCHRWLDLSDGAAGLALLNNGKYGYSLNRDGTGFRLTLLKAALYPESAQEAYDVEKDSWPYLLRSLATLGRQTDQGRHTAWTALYPHAGDWRSARLWEAGYEFNTPFETARAGRHAGSLPSSGSFISVDNPAVYLGALKRAEDDDGLVLRLVEAVGEDQTATVRLEHLGGITQAQQTDLLEWAPQPLPAGPDSISLSFSPHEIKTVKVTLK